MVTNNQTKLILHIGTPKTGTTYLQKNLTKHREFLKEHGVLYPGFYGNLRYQHIAVAKGFTSKIVDWGIYPPNVPAIDPSEWAQKLERIAKRRALEAIIVSSEFFWCSPLAQASELSNEQNWEYVQQFIQLVHDTFQRFNMRVYVWLRRQDLHLDSMANQRIKRGKPPPANYYTTYKPWLDYKKNLELWRDVFGAEKICVSVYEPGKLRDASILDDFSYKTDLPILLEPEPIKPSTKSSNLRVSHTAIEVIRIIEQLNLAPDVRKDIIQAIRLASSNILADTDYLPHFAEPTAQKIMALYDEGNRCVAQEWFGYDGALFNDGIQYRTEADIAQDLTPHNIVALFVELLQSQASITI